MCDTFGHTEKTGVSNFECQNVDSQSKLLDSTTLFPKFFLFGQGDTHLIFCLRGVSTYFVRPKKRAFFRNFFWGTYLR